MIKGDLVYFLEAGEDVVGLKTVTEVVGTTEDDYPVIFMLCFLTLLNFRSATCNNFTNIKETYRIL
jgi:hypothetical protein